MVFCKLESIIGCYKFFNDSFIFLECNNVLIFFRNTKHYRHNWIFWVEEHLYRHRKSSSRSWYKCNCICSGISSFTFTKQGQGFFLNSPSEYIRVTLSSRYVTEPNCAIELQEGMRPEPEPEPEPVVELAPVAEAAEEGAEVQQVQEEDKPGYVISVLTHQSLWGRITLVWKIIFLQARSTLVLWICNIPFLWSL